MISGTTTAPSSLGRMAAAGSTATRWILRIHLLQVTGLCAGLRQSPIWCTGGFSRTAGQRLCRHTQGLQLCLRICCTALSSSSIRTISRTRENILLLRSTGSSTECSRRRSTGRIRWIRLQDSSANSSGPGASVLNISVRR